jgi:hypothetical protein
LTTTEDLIKQLKRAGRSKAIFVPKIEEFLQRPIEIEDDADREFLASLIQVRSTPRKKGVYSPSMLASCLRQIYLIKSGEVTPKKLHRIEASGFFLDGNFRHFKWQFAVWKMHRAGVIQLVDVGTECIGTEIYVENEKRDFGGTLDQLVYLPEENIIVTNDYKGMNGNSFANSINRGPGDRYIWQSVGYAKLANSYLDLPQKIDSVLIIGENKNGPVNNRRVKTPLGLYEWRIPITDHEFTVSRRLKTLRAHERRQELPPIECHSTRQMMFKDCPFAGFCRGEVERVEKKRVKAHKKIKFDQERNGSKSRKSK